jgi:hypothetical protein
MRPYLKNKLRAKRAESVTQVKEYLPSKREALSSNPSTENKLSFLTLAGVYVFILATLSREFILPHFTEQKTEAQKD